MNNLSEALVQEYFGKKGYRISRNTQFTSNQKLIKDELGKSDFLLTTRKGKKIYLEVKEEQTPYLSNSQIKFAKKIISKKEKFWILLVSRLGAYMIFELKKEFKLKIISKGFFKIKNKSFSFFKNRIVLIDFRNRKGIELESHLKKLKHIKKNSLNKSIY